MVGEFLKKYREYKETLKDYVVLRKTTGKVLDTENKEVMSIEIKPGVRLRKIKKVKEKPEVYEMVAKDFPDFRFYVLAKRLKWCNRSEVEAKMKKWQVERKRNE